jgi:hypothetical protein
MALKESFPPGTRFLMGLDANASLRRNIPGITGRWCVRDYAMDKFGDQFAKTLRTLGWEALSTNTMYAAPRKVGGAANYVGTFMNNRGNRVRKQLTYWVGSPELTRWIQNSSNRWGPTLNRHGRHYDHALARLDMTLTHTYFARVPRRDFPQLLRQGGVPLEAYQDSVKRKLSERHRANPKRRQMLEGIVQRDPAELNREIEDRERELYAKQTGTDIHVPDLNITANMLAGAVQTENAETGRVQNTGTGFLREMRETLLTALQDGINFTYEEMIDIANEAYDEASKLGEITAKQDRQSRPTRAGWISDTTREMQRKRQVLLQAKTRQGIPYDRVFLRDLTTDINEQIRKDWRNWLDDILDRLAKADENQDYRTIQYLLGLLGRKRKKGGANKQPTTDAQGKRMVTAIQEANAWRGFLLTLFQKMS